MPLYEYKGFYTAGKSAGKPAKGMKEAPNKQALREALLKGGILLSQATEKSQSGSAAKGTSKPRFEIGGGITKQDVKDFTSQFCTLQKAAIPLVECLNALAEQSEKETLRTVLSDIKTKVSEGSSLAKAMADHPKVFDTLYVSMVRAGESSGALDTVLERLTDFLDSQLRLRSKIIGAMVYPIIMIVVGVMLMGLLFVFVIPRVTKLFDQQRKELPAITKVLLWTTDFLTSYRGLILLAVIGLAAYAFIKWVATPAGKLKWDTFKLKLPLLGGVIRMVSIARFAKTLATLLASG
ncbi:MAG: type II secretion system F family protein, partial [Proteobacteria bacterium]|nr:type II secretion system F family protein [Pseudomonadota bacterium]